MAQDTLRVRFWGTRGSIPVSGRQYGRYGGNTSCIEFDCSGRTFFIDAGSGIREAGMTLMAAGVTTYDIFFTHFHFDHIVGFPFFKPIYKPGMTVTAWSGHLAGKSTTDEVLHDFIRPPWFPVEMDICRSRLSTRDFAAGDTLKPAKGVTLRTGALNHPGGAIGYRIEHAGRAVCVITDTEHVAGTLDPTVLKLIKGADLVIYDCTYTEAELEIYRGFGHSTWEQGVKLCEAAGAKRLAIYHHDPMRTDRMLAKLEAAAKARFSGAFASYDGLVLEL